MQCNIINKGKSDGFPKSRQVSKPRDQYLGLQDGPDIWQAAPQYYRRLRSTAAETPVKYQSHPATLKTNRATPRLGEIWENQVTFFKCNAHQISTWIKSKLSV